MYKKKKEIKKRARAYNKKSSKLWKYAECGMRIVYIMHVMMYAEKRILWYKNIKRNTYGEKKPSTNRHPIVAVTAYSVMSPSMTPFCE